MLSKLMMMATLFLAAVGCGPIQGMMNPDESASYEKLITQEAKLVEAVAADPSLQVELDAVQIEIAELEGVAKRRALGPIWGRLTLIPVVGPYLSLAGPFAATLLIPLTNRRGRKHYWSLVKNITPGVKGSDGTKGPAPMSALADLARAFGMAHSSEASAKAATAGA
jgi:hypothetical protein